MKKIKQEILNAFYEQPGQFISGEALSERCECSRTAVWKYIEELRQEGYQFEAVRKAGYRLVVEPDVLTEEAIQTGLMTRVIGSKVHTYMEVATTQAIAHELAANGAAEGTVVIAEEQVGGKGRLGRAWHSPKGAGLWMSMILRPAMPLPKAPQLTLLTAVAMAKAIRNELGIEIHIKWPNDLLIGGKKCCGILTELNAEADQINYLVIGIGLNVNTEQADFPEELQQIATSLRIAFGAPFKIIYEHRRRNIHENVIRIVYLSL